MEGSLRTLPGPMDSPSERCRHRMAISLSSSGCSAVTPAHGTASGGTPGSEVTVGMDTALGRTGLRLYEEFCMLVSKCYSKHKKSYC